MSSSRICQNLGRLIGYRYIRSSSMRGVAMANESTDAFLYAFEWFKYHAEQRYRAVTLYLIQLVVVPLGGSIAGLIAINVSSEHDAIVKLTISMLALLVSVLGIGLSVIFYILDLRNTEIVKVGEAALRWHEVSMPANCRIFDLKDNLSRQSSHATWQTHSAMFKQLFIIGGMAYFCVALVAVYLLARSYS